MRKPLWIFQKVLLRKFEFLNIPSEIRKAGILLLSLVRNLRGVWVDGIVLKDLEIKVFGFTGFGIFGVFGL